MASWFAARQAFAIGGFEGSVERTKIAGLCALLFGAALLALVIYG
jgi:hypothetical protein